MSPEQLKLNIHKTLDEIEAKTKEQTKKMVENFLAILLFVPSIILNAYMIVCMWTWFGMKLFPVLPQIGLLQAIALRYFVGSIFGDEVPKTSPDPKITPLYVMCYTIVRSLGFLGIGWILHQFV